MSSVTHTAQAERPQERSRNAKAQARHRAKRKAYIDQLEQTVTKLQIAVGYTTEQVSALPPPLLKIRELELDNERLRGELTDLRGRLLSHEPMSMVGSPDTARRTADAYQDSRTCERDYGLKRRKAHDSIYMSPNDTPPHGLESNSRGPPPLTIPSPHTYGAMNTHSHTSNHNGSLFTLHGTPTFQMPNTPSGSSNTSSPPSPFSSTHLDHRQHISDHHHTMPSYSQQSPHYNSVKIEEDNYSTTTATPHNSSIHYSYSTSQNQNHSNMDWHSTYSSERAHAIHR